MEKEIKVRIIWACALLLVVLGALMVWMTMRQNRLILEQSREQADALFESVVLTRRWNAEHGGLYVYKTPGAVSNPYLKKPDIVDTAGKVYTLKNPAMMTKEISALAAERGRFAIHITSLNLKNPENAPDPWERSALMQFEKGAQEVSEAVDIGDRHYFRLMRPLYVEESCLQCHAEQGYKVGDIRGGISVSLPDDERFKELRQNTLAMLAVSLGLVLSLAAVLYFFVWRLMDRLSRQKAELVLLNETKDRFLGTAAHDLRSPLTVMTGYIELFEMADTKAGRAELLAGMSRSVGNMLSLINNLLDISKIRSGKLDLIPEDVEVGMFIRDCANSTGMLCRKKDINLTLSLPDGAMMARFDRQRMGQVLDNLLSNACKFSMPGSEVIMGADRAGDSLRLWVEDHGVGIDEKEIQNVFDEFKRTSSRPTGGESGHGLGLAIVKRMVELHKGRVEVASRRGVGTKFTITLPLG